MNDTLALLTALHSEADYPHCLDSHMLANWGLAHSLISVSDWLMILALPRQKIAYRGGA